MKKLIYILPLFLLACKPQKSIIEYKYLTKTDTLIRTQTNTVYKGVTDTITVENICDSLGIINNFYSKLTLPNGTITIRSERGDNKLKAFVKLNDILSTTKRELQSRTSDSVTRKEKEVIKYRIPSWIIYTVIVETLLIALYVYLRIKKLLLI